MVFRIFDYGQEIGTGHTNPKAKNRRAVRKYGGIRKLVRLLKITDNDEQVSIAGAQALCSCSKSRMCFFQVFLCS